MLLTLDRPRALLGRVRGLGGEGVSGALIEARVVSLDDTGRTVALPLSRRTLSRDDGTFELQGLGNALYEITITPSAAALLRSHEGTTKIVRLRPDGRHREFDVGDLTAVGKLAILTRTPDGRLLPSVRVHYRHESDFGIAETATTLRSEPGAAASLTVYRGGRSYLEIAAHGYPPERLGPISFDNPLHELDISLQLGVTLKLDIRDSRGNPRGDLTVEFEDANGAPLQVCVGPEHRPTASIRTGRNSRIAVFDVPAATIVIRVSARGRSTEVRVRGEPGGTLEVPILFD